MKKTWIFWVIAIFITLAAAYYQRITGPTYPIKATVIFNNQEYSFKLLRSHGGESDCEILIPIEENGFEANIVYKKYPSNDEWQRIAFAKGKNGYVALLPNQPPAGKLMYFVEVNQANAKLKIPTDKEAIIRFKGDVPTFVLAPHVFFMFLAMLISNLAAILAFVRHQRFRFYAFLTFFLLLIGGMILGPVVQKYAFGEFWTGIPFGWDLTDNKTLFAFMAWLIAIMLNWKKERPWAIIVAAIVLLLIYSIPHSTMGSELNHATGKITTG
ncbi:MAG TPA: hypothetical protein DDX39_08125 [Bacteroidales bacterium]|nr:MAG: hypothetical protein A2W98_14830 [Bacteroidetes bacterium GWF2_33_38]OFY74717.1 MAG: hypothetical protein A2265_09185 [Bacteroidetes bacterium RIFOXYA12_FULL_33_9]OFY91327.1 MAG: hypothetical protein A2236_13735 [Bacteroidetes bacterium RIFOXYA2_FULL_33_7]HBF88594.1 hypothetical protein [Bacteroidales bacterium]